MTIKEAFDKHKVIRIDYIWESYCKYCDTLMRYDDEEYGFEGDKEYFIEKYCNPSKNYPDVLEFDSKIQHIQDNHYEFVNDYVEQYNYCDNCESDYIKAMFDEAED